MYFLDTYALIEIIKGNSNYQEYAQEDFITTKLNLMEVYYTLLRLFNQKTAEHYYDLLLPACIELEDNAIKIAMLFRLEQRKQKNLMSYIDSVSYIVALTNNIRIVTGEKHFLGLRNVEFVR